MKSDGEDAEKREPSCTVGENVNSCSLHGNTVEVPQTFKSKLPRDPETPLQSPDLKGSSQCLEDRWAPLRLSQHDSVAKKRTLSADRGVEKEGVA